MCIYGVGVWWDGRLGNTLAYIHGAEYCSLLSFGIYNTTIQILKNGTATLECSPLEDASLERGDHESKATECIYAYRF